MLAKLANPNEKIHVAGHNVMSLLAGAQFICRNKSTMEAVHSAVFTALCNVQGGIASLVRSKKIVKNGIFSGQSQNVAWQFSIPYNDKSNRFHKVIFGLNQDEQNRMGKWCARAAFCIAQMSDRCSVVILMCGKEAN